MDLPTNEDRTNWAMASVALFAETTGLNVDKELTESVSDLLANMMHLCASKGLEFDDLLRVAKSAFDEEVAEEAEEEDSFEMQ